MADTRVLLVDDHEPWRLSVVSMLKRHGELHIIGEAADGLEAIQKAESLKPDLILLDIALPNLNGIEVANRLCLLLPGAKVLFVSGNNDADVVRAAFSNGAQGYVLKADAGIELLPAVQAILRGEKFVSSGLRSRL